jgi:hypothetical protein
MLFPTRSFGAEGARLLRESERLQRNAAPNTTKIIEKASRIVISSWLLRTGNLLQDPYHVATN